MKPAKFDLAPLGHAPGHLRYIYPNCNLPRLPAAGHHRESVPVGISERGLPLERVSGWCPGAGGPDLNAILQLSRNGDRQVATMTTEMRKTGIDVVGDMPWGTHFCLFYETKDDILDTLVSFCKAGLER